MATAGSIVVDLVAKTGSFETSMDRAVKRTRAFQKDVGAASAAVVAMTGALAATAFGVFISETMQAEKEQAQLTAVLKSTGEAAGFTRSQLNDMASSISSMSTVSAGEINQAQTTLLAFTGIVGEEFPKALQAAVDMAARTGMSVVQASETIGRALDVPSQGLSSLSKQGFRFTDEQKKMAERMEATGRTAEAQGIILSALGESYGGAAAAARDTFGGALVGLKNQLDDLMTGEDGSLDGAKNSVNQLTATLASEETKAAFATFVSMISNAANAFATFMTTVNEGSFWGWVQTSGADAKNAEAEIGKLEESLAKLGKTRKAFDDSLVPAWMNADDIAIVDTQIASIESKLQTLRVIAKKNASDANRAINDSVIGSGYGVALLPPVPVKPTASGSKPSASGKTGKTARTSSEDFLGDFIKEQEAAFNQYQSFIDQITGRADMERLDQQTKWLEHARNIGEITGEEFEKGIESIYPAAQEATDAMGEFALEAARGIQQSLGDGLYDILSGNFDSIGDKFGEMIFRMAADAAAANLAQAMFGDYDKSGKIGGIIGNIAGSLFGPSGVADASALQQSGGDGIGHLISVNGWDSGGFTGHGGKYEPAGIVHKGEVVFSQDDVRRNGGVSRVESMRLRGYSGGGVVGGASGAGAGPNMKINIINQNNEPVQGQSSGPRFDGEQWVIDIVLNKARKSQTFRDQLRGGM